MSQGIHEDDHRIHIRPIAFAATPWHPQPGNSHPTPLPTRSTGSWLFTPTLAAPASCENRPESQYAEYGGGAYGEGVQIWSVSHLQLSPQNRRILTLNLRRKPDATTRHLRRLEKEPAGSMFSVGYQQRASSSFGSPSRIQKSGLPQSQSHADDVPAPVLDRHHQAALPKTYPRLLPAPPKEQMVPTPAMQQPGLIQTAHQVEDSPKGNADRHHKNEKLKVYRRLIPNPPKKPMRLQARIRQRIKYSLEMKANLFRFQKQTRPNQYAKNIKYPRLLPIAPGKQRSPPPIIAQPDNTNPRLRIEKWIGDTQDAMLAPNGTTGPAEPDLIMGEPFAPTPLIEMLAAPNEPNCLQRESVVLAEPSAEPIGPPLASAIRWPYIRLAPKSSIFHNSRQFIDGMHQSAMPINSWHPHRSLLPHLNQSGGTGFRPNSQFSSTSYYPSNQRGSKSRRRGQLSTGISVVIGSTANFTGNLRAGQFGGERSGIMEEKL